MKFWTSQTPFFSYLKKVWAQCTPAPLGLIDLAWVLVSDEDLKLNRTECFLTLRLKIDSFYNDNFEIFIEKMIQKETNSSFKICWVVLAVS